jgi:hypothetical protein
MRFVLTDGDAPTLEAIEGMLKQRKPQYSIVREPGATVGDLFYRDEVYGEIGATSSTDETTAQYLVYLAELLPNAEEGDQAAVEVVLKKATGVVHFEFPTEEEPSAMAQDIIDPLWQWLYANRSGLLQVDDIGYFDKNGRVLSFPQ